MDERERHFIEAIVAAGAADREAVAEAAERWRASAERSGAGGDGAPSRRRSLARALCEEGVLRPRDAVAGLRRARALLRAGEGVHVAPTEIAHRPGSASAAEAPTEINLGSGSGAGSDSGMPTVPWAPPTPADIAGAVPRHAPPGPSDGLRPASSTGGERVLVPGARLGPYTLLDVLGRGGMGVVWRARDDRLDREVALKTLHGMPSEQAFERLRREARAAARLRHPGIVAVYEAELHEGTLTVALELIDGESLSTRLAREGPFSPRDAAAVVRDLAVAVEAAHAEGIIHRDLKPANVLVQRPSSGSGTSERIRLTDFGLARDERASQLTVTGQVLGTPCYMAPEQADGGYEPITPATDVYGLGAILYELLTGRPPFEGDTMVEIIRRVIEREPIPPSRVRAARGLPPLAPALETVCLRALAKEPGDRYRSAVALADDLRRFLDGEPVEARPVGRLRRLSRWARRNRALTAALLLVALLAVALGGLGAREAWLRSLAAVAERDRRREVEAIIAQLGDPAGELTPEEAARSFLRFEGEATVEILAAELDAIAAELEQAALAELLTVAEPTAEERRAGEGPIEDLEEAAVRWAAPRPQEPPVAGDAERVERALARLRRRVSRGVLDGSFHDRPPPPDSLIASAQERRVGPVRLRVARAACEALGRLRSGGDAIPALVRYLLVERDQRRAAAAVEALLRIGTGEAEDAVLWIVYHRFKQGTGPVWDRLGAVRPTDEHGRARPPSSAAGWTMQGLLAHKRGDNDRALVCLDRAVALASGHVAVHINRSIVRREAGDAQGAIEDGARAIELAPRDAGAWVVRGAARDVAGDAEGAIADYDRAIELDRFNPSAWIGRASARKEVGDLPGAISDATRGIELDPDLVAAWANRAQARFRAGDYRGAIDDYGVVTELAPLEPAGFHERADARLRAGDLEGALADARHAVEIAPEDSGARLSLGQVHAARGDLTAALANLDVAVALAPTDGDCWANRGQVRNSAGDQEGAIADFTRALELGVIEPHVVRNNLALARWNAGDLAAARAGFDAVIVEAPGYAVAWSNRALLRKDAGDLAGAIADGEKAVALDPGLAETWVNLGDALVDAGEPARGLAACDRALALAPALGRAFSVRAFARAALGDPEGAVADANRAVELAPHDARMFTNRGIVRGDLGDRAAAIEDFTRAIELAPNDADSWANRALSRSETGDHEGALADLDKALELDASLRMAWINRGAVHMEQGDAAAAVEDFTRAIELDADDAVAWSNRGLAREEAGDEAGAVEDWTRALELRPESVAARVKRGAARARAGDRAGAIADFERFLELHPDSPYAQQVRGFLARLREAR